MAIYHLNARVGSRSSGQSAAAKFAYICREGRYADGKQTRVDKDELVHFDSGNLPSWAVGNPALYWQAADQHERANGRLFQQVEVALPVELDQEQQIQLAHEFARALATTETRSLPYTFAVHRGKGENPHAHIIVSERINDGHGRTPETWFKRAAVGKLNQPEFGGAKKTDAFQGREWLGVVRQQWAAQANAALEMAGRSERIDHRSYAEQGLEGLPTVHEGPNVRQMKERDLQSNRAAMHDEIQEARGELAEIQAESEIAQKQLGLLLNEVEAADAKLIEPATTSNIFLLAIANQVERKSAESFLVDRKQAAVFCDAMLPGDVPKGSLYGEGAGVLNELEGGMQVGQKKSREIKQLARLEVRRTAKGFEYVITVLKGMLADFIAYLRKAAAKQLKWDSDVLRSRSRQKEQPIQDGEEPIAIVLTEKQVRQLIGAECPNDFRKETTAMHNIYTGAAPVSVMDGRVALDYSDKRQVFFAALAKDVKPLLDARLTQLEGRERARNPKQSPEPKRDPYRKGPERD